MFSRARRLRLRRQIRMHKHQLNDMEAGADQYFFRRLDNIVPVRRFILMWVALIFVLVGSSAVQIYSLSSYYQELKPAAGGMYTEGVLGAYTNANPIYASTAADRTVSRLLFGSLLAYDTQNQLAPDLAESWQADQRGQIYTVKLKPNLTWHDGAALTANDVVFTFNVIQNPDARSPLNASWQGIKVESLDAHTVKFTLNSPLASFPHSLTTGILPQHILGNVSMATMRSVPFNSVQPVGSGPFVWQDLVVSGGTPETRRERVILGAFEAYHFGRPKLDTFTMETYRVESEMIESYKRNEIQAMVGLTNMPADLGEAKAQYFPQTAAMMTFFKTNTGVLAEKPIRQALVQSVDVESVRKQLAYPARSVTEPILEGQIGYDNTVGQLPYDIAAAEKLLNDAGWVQSKPGEVRKKAEQKLEFTLYAESNHENARTSRALQQQWRKIGVNALVELQNPAEFQVTLSQHGYDALLRGISIGPDPDVFVYWHSSQADIGSGSRLNFSEYKSNTVDDALNQARARIDPQLRAAKYKPFLTTWRDDAPALGLYQPSFLYVTRQTVYGLEPHEVNNANDRLANVHEWMVRQVKTTVDN